MSDKMKLAALSGIGLGFVDRAASAYAPPKDINRLLFPNSPDSLVLNDEQVVSSETIIRSLSAVFAD